MTIMKRANELGTHLARLLRRSQPDAEQILWRHLRGRQLDGHKFRRQYPVGPYVADFVCFKQQLIVEIDGGQHDERQAYDARRTAFLESRGFKVIRFWNNDVLQKTEAVLTAILVVLSAPHPTPSPNGRRVLPTPPSGEGRTSTSGAPTSPGVLPPLPSGEGWGEGSRAKTDVTMKGKLQ